MVEFVDGIKNGIGELREKHARALDPKTVIAAVQKEAKRNSKEWGDEARPEAPNLYTVKIGTEDWRKYYGTRRASMEERVAKKIYLSLGALGLSMEGYPSIKLEEDASVQFGSVSVDAVFGDKVDVPEDLFKQQRSELERGRPARSAATVDFASGPTEPMGDRANVGDWSIPKTKVIGGKGKFARGSAKTAKLVGSSAVFTVKSGDTIGVVRYEDRPRPDIALKWEDFKNASQDHGVFAYDEEEGCWAYENHGGWGTVVVSGDDGQIYELAEGERVFLDDGDKMTIAENGTFSFEYD